MKKHITLLSSLCLAGTFYAQKTINAPMKMPVLQTEEVEAVKGSTQAPKALGATLWSSDFTNASDWVIDNDGQSGGNFGWNINATKEGWANNTTQGIINSVSDGNFAELGNGNPTLTPGTQALDVDYYLTSANPVAITSTNLTLSFLQNGALFQISVDGTNWITVGDNSDKEVLSQSGGSPYPNPDAVNISLASFIPGGSTQLWVRFHWTTRFPASATNPNVWITYGWNIDDVAITEAADYDLEVEETYWGSVGLNYYQIPNTQIAPIEFTAKVNNIGNSPLTNVSLGVDVNAGAFTGSSPASTINSLSSDSLVLSTLFTPSGNGTYAVDRSLNMTETDDVPLNNPISDFTFTVNDNIYARDNNTPNGYTTNATGFETGNLYDIFADQEVKGVNVRVASGSTANIEVYVSIYDASSGADFIYVGGSDPVPVPASSMNNSNLTFLLNDPVTLTAGVTYLVVAGSYDTGLRIANGGYAPDQTSFLLDGNDIAVSTLYYQNDVPMVRLNFDPTLSAAEIADVATNVLASPNPFNNETNVSFNLKNTAEVSLVVTDLAGRVVYSAAPATMNAGEQVIAIDGSSFGAGMYNYTLTIEGKSITNRIVKK
jgi:hypothetical protein